MRANSLILWCTLVSSTATEAKNHCTQPPATTSSGTLTSWRKTPLRSSWTQNCLGKVPIFYTICPLQEFLQGTFLCLNPGVSLLLKTKRLRSTRIRLLSWKIHLDGKLLLLAILRMSNVVKQVPSQDDVFFNFTYRLIRHSLRRMFSYIMKHLTATEWATKYHEVA